MSLLSNSNKKDGKKGKQKPNNLPGVNNSFAKPSKAQAFSKKPLKTGGTRGS